MSVLVAGENLKRQRVGVVPASTSPLAATAPTSPMKTVDRSLFGDASRSKVSTYHRTQASSGPHEHKWATEDGNGQVKKVVFI